MSKIEYIVHAKNMTLCMQGDRVEDIDEGTDEYGTHDTLEAAVAEADALACEHGNVKLHDQRGGGIGAIDHKVYYVDAFLYDEELDELVPCDKDGNTDDSLCPDPVYCRDCLDDHPKLKAAWDKAVKAKWKYLDYGADEFYTVRAFLNEE